MTIRFILVGWLLALCAAPAVAAKEIFSFAYLQRENDPAYEQHHAYTGLTLRDRTPPLDGAKTGMRESRVLGRALGVKFRLREVMLGEREDAVAAISALIEEGIGVFLLDLPLADVREAAAAFADKELLLFNIRHGSVELRGEGCSPVLFHTIASDAMLMDGLAQFLFQKNWTDVLLLEGLRRDDIPMIEVFDSSKHEALKFPVSVLRAVVSDKPVTDVIPNFRPGEIEKIVNFMEVL